MLSSPHTAVHYVLLFLALMVNSNRFQTLTQTARFYALLLRVQVVYLIYTERQQDRLIQHCCYIYNSALCKLYIMQVNYTTGVYDLFEILESAVIWYNGCRYLWVTFEAQDHHKSNTVAVVSTDPPNSCKPATCFAVIKTNSPNLYKSPTCFVVVKTDSPNFYNAPICFAVVKTDSPNLRISLQHALRLLKRTLWTSTSLQHALQLSKQTLRTSTSL